jgi:EAL domain-containing protein (putative c-di-GMP-specific phosphodiesterase class I)
MTTDTMVTVHDCLPELAREMGEQGSRGVVMLDAGALSTIEDDYGTQAFEEVRQRVMAIMLEQRGRDYRDEDVLALDTPRGMKFVLFLDRKRRRNLPMTMADLRVVRNRFVASLVPALARAAFPYIKSGARFDVGYGMAMFNPLVHVDRTIRRAIQDASELASHQRQADALQTREKLQDILLREKVVTAFQPILKMSDRTFLGFEALSRGPRGSGLEGADALFGAAEEHNLLVELDRLCRQRALLSSGRIPTNAKIFVNTLPATIRDPQFRGRALIDFLHKAQVAPNRIVIEITEKLVIENYNLFRETMDYFTALGVQFAVDDVGSGYSGLESIARLKPSYLKIDIGLVRDVHVSLVNREMVKAILALGQGIGSTVIAEGIQAEDEMDALREMGIEYGQGFLLARPDTGPE